jgi:hypothetical protein
MPNTNDAEKDRTGPPGDRRNCSGVGCTAWPMSCGVPLVSSSRPVDVITAVPFQLLAGEARVDELVVSGRDADQQADKEEDGSEGG